LVTASAQSLKGVGHLEVTGIWVTDDVQRAVKGAISASMAIGRLRELRPAQMRQLYQACVVPRMDYASTYVMENKVLMLRVRYLTEPISDWNLRSVCEKNS
jgi:hypothetical protein